MAFHFVPEEPFGEGLRRIVREQALEAAEGIERAVGGGAPAEEAIHEARKRFKRVRGALRLGRAALGRRALARELHRYRDLGRLLSESRDAAVLVHALDDLNGRSGGTLPTWAVDQARSALLARKAEEDARLIGPDGPLVAVAEGARVGRRAAKRWDVRPGDDEALAAGLRRLYARGRKAMRAAEADPADESLHEWRKRAKDLWHAFELLEPSRPAVYGHRAGRAHALSDALGTDHDLAVLAATLSDPDAAILAPEAAAPLLEAITARRADLRREALEIGAEVYGERPRAVVERVVAFWRAWRTAVEAERLA